MQVLPNISTIATLDPHTLVIELPSESHASLINSIAGATNSKASEHYHHELRHFEDLVGTLWGQDYLDLLFAAYDAVLTSPGSETIYPALLNLFDVDRAILFPSYYKYVMPAAPHGSVDDRWTMGFSAGVRVRPDGRSDESAPILFVRFDKGDQHVARQPVTAGSLLEMRAAGMEFGVFSRWIGTRPAEERLIEERVRSRERMALVYDPQLTTYSVASHIAAFFLRDSNLGAMMDAGFKVSEIALNMNGNAFGHLRHPEGLLAGQSRERRQGFKAQRDRGYAYAVLLHQLRGLGPVPVGEAAIEVALRSSGLRPIDTIFDTARSTIERKRVNAFKNPTLREIRERLIGAGLELLQRWDFDRFALMPRAEPAPGPMVMTGQDGADFHVGVPAISVEQSYFLHECYWQLRDATRLALRAARGFDFEFTDYVY